MHLTNKTAVIELVNGKPSDEGLAVSIAMLEELGTSLFCDLDGIADLNITDACFPVGSVAFITRFSLKQGTYLQQIDPYLFASAPNLYKRKITMMRKLDFMYENSLARVYIRPYSVELFNGFIYPPETEEAKIECAKFMQCGGNNLIAVSDVVEFKLVCDLYFNNGRFVTQDNKKCEGCTQTEINKFNDFCLTIIDLINTTKKLSCVVRLAILANGEPCIVCFTELHTIPKTLKLSNLNYAKCLVTRWEQLQEYTKITKAFEPNRLRG